MSRISKIILDTRSTLGDKNEDRYSTSLIVDKLNEAIEDFIISSNINKEIVYIELNKEQAIYDLSSIALNFNRVEYNHKNIVYKSLSDLDKIDMDWTSTMGNSVEYVSTDGLPKGSIRIYPRLNTVKSIVQSNSNYGILVDFTIDDVTVQLPDIEEINKNIKQYLVVYTNKKPAKVEADTEDEFMEVPSEWDKALVFYITGMLLRTDSDTNNRQFGTEQLGYYSNYVKKAKNDEAKSNSNMNIRLVAYNGGLN